MNLEEFPSLDVVSCHREVFCTAKNTESAALPVLYRWYNRLQQYYADLFFTVNNIEQYYSS
jgi:hypothetical protein